MYSRANEVFRKCSSLKNEGRGNRVPCGAICNICFEAIIECTVRIFGAQEKLEREHCKNVASNENLAHFNKNGMLQIIHFDDSMWIFFQRRADFY